MSSTGEKTEKATPKRRDEARKEGRVARSMEINSAFAMLAGFTVLLAWGPTMWETLTAYVTHVIANAHQVDTSVEGMQREAHHALRVVARILAPIFAAMFVAGVLANLIQLKFRITPEVIKPRFKKLNPINGFKQKFSPQQLVELMKTVIKTIAVATPAMGLVWANRDNLMALGGVHPALAAAFAFKMVVQVGLLVGAIYIFIAAIDYVWQRWRHEKSIRMTKHEVKQEMRQQDMSPELKAQQRRRQRDAARNRMLADVADADVVITNPTHYSVALKYSADEGAPRVVAKGVDLLALRIRELADEHGVSRVENRPLARSLYAQCEVGEFIPADMFAAVAEILAFVYRADHRGGGSRSMEHA